MARTFAVVGTGDAPETVIKEGLTDLKLTPEDHVNIVWYGKPGPGLSATYDYILDNKVEFSMFHHPTVQPPKAFTSSDFGDIIASEDPEPTSLLTASAVLVLWDDAKAESLVHEIFDIISDNVNVFELTNGLAPISLSLAPDSSEVESSVTAEVFEEEDPTEEADAPSTFTREELSIMPVGSLKRLAVAAGLPEGVTGKTNYIKVILGEELPNHALPPGITPYVEPEEEPAVPVTLGDSDPTQPPPTAPTVVGYEELRQSLYPKETNKEQDSRIENLRQAALHLGEHIISSVPVGRHRSLALKALEDVVMRSVQAISSE